MKPAAHSTTTGFRTEKNCFIQIREFGPKGWNKLLPALFLSDRVDTWIPSGKDLQEARKTNTCPLTEQDFIGLLKAGVVRAGVRKANIMQNTGKVFHGPGDTALDRFLRAEFENGEGTVVDHPQYNSASVALEEIRNMASAPALSRYTVARQYAEAHLSGAERLPPFVVERAGNFKTLPLSEIQDPDIRECMQFIRSIADAKEREILLLCSQILRLAVEHDNFMRTQNCNVIFGHEHYATLLKRVAGASTIESKQDTPIPDTLQKILELIDFLLAQNPVTDFEDVLRRHEKLAGYRDAIWDLGDRAGEIDQFLRQQIHELRPVDYVFGREPVGQALGIAGSAVTLGTVVSGLLDSLALGSLVSFGIATARVVNNVRVTEKSRLHGSGSTWLGVLVYDTQRPTRDEMQRIARDLEYHIMRRRTN